MTGLYETLLGRAPDATGRAYWVDRAATRGRTDVALALYQSRESRARRVDQLYADLLARTPEAAGRDFWVNRIATTGDLALAAALAASPEYLARTQVRFFG